MRTLQITDRLSAKAQTPYTISRLERPKDKVTEVTLVAKTCGQQPLKNWAVSPGAAVRAHIKNKNASSRVRSGVDLIAFYILIMLVWGTIYVWTSGTQ